MKKVILSLVMTLSVISAVLIPVYAEARKNESVITGSGIMAIGKTAGAFGGSGVDAVADAVTLIKTGLLGRKMVFSEVDFKTVLAVDDFDKITVTSLPSARDGTLMLAGRRVRAGQDIKRRNIAALVFVPESDEVSQTEFTFTLDGGSECICKLNFISKINYSPKIEEANRTGAILTTQREIGVHGKIPAVDPEGDRLEYMIVSYPSAGYVTLGEGGEYVYTPKDGVTGYDSFTAVARDEWGNWSRTVTVRVKIIERMSEIVYKDLSGAAEYNAAVAMTALGVMSAREDGGSFYFDSEASITREEFVTMALKAVGIAPTPGESYFDDDAEITESMKGYIRRAASMGIIDGEFDGAELTFSPKAEIKLYEAVDIMARILSVEDGEGAVYNAPDTVPIWARGGYSALMVYGVVDEDDDPEIVLTRGSAAELLYKMVNNC